MRRKQNIMPTTLDIPPAGAARGVGIGDALGRMIRLVDSLRTHQSDMQAQQVHLLLMIALHPDLTQVELAGRAGLNTATTSRNIAMLTQKGWVEAVADAVDSRLKRIHLTTQGKHFVSSLIDTLYH